MEIQNKLEKLEDLVSNLSVDEDDLEDGELRSSAGDNAADSPSESVPSTMLLDPDGKWTMFVDVRVLAEKSKEATRKCGHSLQLLKYDATIITFSCQLCSFHKEFAGQAGLPTARQPSRISADCDITYEEISDDDEENPVKGSATEDEVLAPSLVSNNKVVEDDEIEIISDSSLVSEPEDKAQDDRPEISIPTTKSADQSQEISSSCPDQEAPKPPGPAPESEHDDISLLLMDSPEKGNGSTEEPELIIDEAEENNEFKEISEENSHIEEILYPEIIIKEDMEIIQGDTPSLKIRPLSELQENLSDLPSYQTRQIAEGVNPMVNIPVYQIDEDLVEEIGPYDLARSRIPANNLPLAESLRSVVGSIAPGIQQGRVVWTPPPAHRATPTVAPAARLPALLSNSRVSLSPRPNPVITTGRTLSSVQQVRLPGGHLQQQAGSGVRQRGLVWMPPRAAPAPRYQSFAQFHQLRPPPGPGRPQHSESRLPAGWRRQVVTSAGQPLRVVVQDRAGRVFTSVQEVAAIYPPARGWDPSLLDFNPHSSQ